MHQLKARCHGEATMKHAIIGHRKRGSLRNLYELPIKLRRTATVTTGIDTQLKAGTWAIDSLHSSINFSIRHLVVGKVRGRFSEFSGSITVPDNGIPSVLATIAVGSVDTGNKDRDHHVKAADFFDVRTSPPRPSGRRDCAKTMTDTRSTASSPYAASPSRSH